MFKRKGILKKKHYLLIVFVIVLIAFFQPFVLLLGNLMIVAGLAAYIYSDLTPEAQDELENKFTNGMKNVRDYLRRSPDENEDTPIPPPKRGRFERLLSRSKAPDKKDEAAPPAVDSIVDAEIIREHEAERETRH